MEEEYRIEMTEELVKELSVVCNLGEYIARKSKEQGRMEGFAEGLAEERLEGRMEGERLIGTLMDKLFSLGRVDDAKRCTTDVDFRNALYKEFQLA
ncbi:MAG: hypothetical protein IJ719_10640 [Clostridia bacterium]|nr:hypothetical protein [Clostridia bacterium]